MCNGGYPGLPAYCTLQPSCVRPSTRSPMGRSCMRGTPRSTKWPSSTARTAVNGRMAVPAFPRNRSVGDCGCLQLSGKQASHAFDLHLVVPDCSTRQPICCSAINMTRVSSESSTPCSAVPPLHNPASNSTRLLMLLELGNVHRSMRRLQRRNIKIRRTTLGSWQGINQWQYPQTAAGLWCRHSIGRPQPPICALPRSQQTSAVAARHGALPKNPPL